MAYSALVSVVFLVVALLVCLCRFHIVNSTCITSTITILSVIVVVIVALAVILQRQACVRGEETYVMDAVFVVGYFLSKFDIRFGISAKHDAKSWLPN